MPKRFLLPSICCVILTAATIPLPAQNATSKNSSAATEERIHRVENGIPPIPLGPDQPPLQFTLQQLMDVLKVPGLSVAVVDDFKIVWAKPYGVTEAGTTNPVTTTTLFQAASISKVVSATGALYLVEHGKLSLDEDVNKELTTWKVPENEFTATQKVTLRRLLSHTAGTTVHGFPGYAVGEPIPTVVQILNGEKPANTAPVRVDLVPGTRQRYSGGGVTIEQLLVTDVTGKPFPQFMQQTVLGPIGMTNSTFQQPLPPGVAAHAAAGTLADGKPVPGKWHIYPELAAAGLWTTPTDLAKFGIEIALSKNGKSNRVLNEAMTRQMLTPQIAGAKMGSMEDVGLGFFLGTGGNPNEFDHGGSNAGYRCIMMMLSDTGQGLAIMTNSDRGMDVGGYLIESIAKEYGWNYTPPKHSAGEVLSLVEAMRGTQAAMQEYQYLKKASPPPYQLDESTLNLLGYELLDAGKFDDAIQVFKLNVAEYPKSSNPYDSLGEAYMKAGKKELAIQNYTKSVELDPKNQNGIGMLKKLKEQK
jgi:CubicO group peptidase (beta-lactamase class C family)